MHLATWRNHPPANRFLESARPHCLRPSGRAHRMTSESPHSRNGRGPGWDQCSHVRMFGAGASGLELHSESNECSCEFSKGPGPSAVPDGCAGRGREPRSSTWRGNPTRFILAASAAAGIGALHACHGSAGSWIWCRYAGMVMQSFRLGSVEVVLRFNLVIRVLL